MIMSYLLDAVRRKDIFRQGKQDLKGMEMRSSLCGTTGSEASWEHQVTGFISSPAQWVKDLALLQLWLRLQLWLGSDLWPRHYICCWASKKKRKGMEMGKNTWHVFYSCSRSEGRPSGRWASVMHPLSKSDGKL